MAKSRFIYGFHALNATLRHHSDDVVRIYYDENRKDPRMQKLLSDVNDLQLPSQIADEHRLAQMSGTKQHQGVAAEIKERPKTSFREFLTSLDMENNPIIMLLDSITDPHNLGACFRVADAFGVSAIVVPKDNNVGINATVVKTASGTTETVTFFTVTNLVRCMEQLKEKGFWIFGTDATNIAKPINQLDLTGPMVWVFGSEGKGMRHLTRQHCDFLTIVPMVGEVESLNISVAAGVCLYETQRQRKFSPPPLKP